MVITRKKLNEINERYGQHASWAIWNPDDILDTSLIDRNVRDLRTDVVMVGLNVSADVSGRSWRNFHMGKNDPRLRLAFNESPLRGAYMTDVLKDVVISKATNVRRMIRAGAIDAAEHAREFAIEMSSIGADTSTTFLVFGCDAQWVYTKYLASTFPDFINCEHFGCYRTTADWLLDLWLNIDSNSNISPTSTLDR